MRRLEYKPNFGPSHSGLGPGMAATPRQSYTLAEWVEGSGVAQVVRERGRSRMNKPEITTSNLITAKIVTLDIPKDPQLLAAVGTVTLRHSQMDHMLRMTIKSLTGKRLLVAMDETAFLGSATLRKRIYSLAESRLGEGEELRRLQSLLARCESATMKRNRLVHDVWFRDPNAETLRRTDGSRETEVPTVPMLDALARELEQLASELNTARRKGFLAKALAAKK